MKTSMPAKFEFALRHAFALAFLGVLSACASAPTLSSVQLIDKGEPMVLQGPAVVEICASWSGPCIINARVLDEVCDIVCPLGVQVVTVLVDESFDEGLKAYREGFGIKHAVVSPGAGVLSGASALGSTIDIPAIYIFDKNGKRTREVRGGIASLNGIIRALKETGVKLPKPGS